MFTSRNVFIVSNMALEMIKGLTDSPTKASTGRISAAGEGHIRAACTYALANVKVV